MAAAAEHLSLRQAALALAIQPATLNRSIRRLETSLGVQLFERRSNGVRLTEHGESFLLGARRVLGEIDMLASLSESRRRASARLSIGFNTSLSAGNLRATVLEGLRRTAGAELGMVSGPSPELLQDVRTGRLDVAIVVPEDDEWPEARLALWNERVVAVLPSDHRLADRDVVDWEELRNEALIVGDDPPVSMFVPRTAPSSFGRIGAVRRYEIDARHILSLVGAGAGVSVTLESSVGELHSGVVYRQLHRLGEVVRMPFCAFWRSDNPSPSLSALLHALRERYPEVPGGSF